MATLADTSTDLSIAKVRLSWRGVNKIRCEWFSGEISGNLTALDSILLREHPKSFLPGEPVYLAADGKVTFINTGSPQIGYYSGEPLANDMIGIFVGMK